MSLYLILVALPLILSWNLYWLIVRPAVKRNRALMEKAITLAGPDPEPLPEPRIPRDTSRPYPRPKGGRRKQDGTCPVCGTGSGTGSLDGRVLGWRAHRSCAEWLGDWKPPTVSAQEIAALRKALDGSAHSHKILVLPPGGTTISVKNSPGAQINAGNGNSQPGVAAEPVFCQNGKTDPIVLMTQQGMISLDEARERLDQEIVATWGVPPAALEEHTHKVGDPVPGEQCPECGAQFCGTPAYLRQAFKMHRHMGCR